MNPKRLLFLFTLIPFISTAQPYYKTGSFVIKGQVKNFKDPVFDFGMTNYLDNMGNSVKVQANGSFEQGFPIQHKQHIYLYLNDDAITITIQNKDTLTLHWDNDNFKNTFTIKANNELRTKELKRQLKLYYEFREPFMDLHKNLYKDKNLTADNKYTIINELYNRNVQAALDSSDFSENFNDLITGLYFQYTDVLRSHHLIPKFTLKLALDTTRSYPFFDMTNKSFDYTLLNENWFWNVPEYRHFIYNYLRFFRPFNSWVASATTSSTAKSFNPTLDEYYIAQANINYTTIKDWFITKSIIDGFGHYAFADVEQVYKQAINTFTSPYLKDTLQKFYTAVKRLKPGNPAPGFSLKNDQGKMVSLSDFKGKVLYIDFWGVGCGPCIYDIEKYIPKLHEHYKNKDVVFLNICVDAKENEWKEALKKYKLDGVNLIAEGWSNHPVCKAYNVSGIPHYILIDKNGKISNNNAPGGSMLNLSSGKNAIDLLLK